MTADIVTELHALAVLDVLEAAQVVVDDWCLEGPNWKAKTHALLMDRLEDALTRLDRLEVVQAAA